jgi:hypothetical protein
LASFASMVARAGVWPGTTHFSHTGVHRREILHVGQEDLRGQQLRLVAARLLQELLDLRQHLLGLPGDVERAVVRHLARQVHGVAVDHDLGEALADVHALDGHGRLPGFVIRGRGH